MEQSTTEARLREKEKFSLILFVPPIKHSPCIKIRGGREGELPYNKETADYSEVLSQRYET